ncbi:hypothetical protein BOW51_00365 [Solemya velesiana gill symbiont]|uniref:Uncharacterized protein n=1 Tax=Solemya velesiana gill symbiont TaxID=1918948 RepID=A0A1T2KYH5_9GAMM|nr:hypothetical protein BOW51_00365 [Solemya velesiana gill symbiont]
MNERRSFIGKQIGEFASHTPKGLGKDKTASMDWTGLWYDFSSLVETIQQSLALPDQHEQLTQQAAWLACRLNTLARYQEQLAKAKSCPLPSTTPWAYQPLFNTQVPASFTRS